MDVLLTMGNWLLQVSVPGAKALPEDLSKLLESRLCYTHATYNQPTFFSKKDISV